MSEYWSVIAATVIFALVGGMTVCYTIKQLNKNFILSLMKVVRARVKKYKKLKDSLPLPTSGGKNLTFVVKV